MADRFGPIPQQVEDLFITVRCRRLAVELGFEKMVLKEETLRCYFINNPDSPYFESDTFNKMLQFVQTVTHKARLKQTGRNFLLIHEDIKGMEQLYHFLFKMHQYTREHVDVA
jgi:transcription-repair coupling factor (superfamily II helicase)